MNDVYIGPAEKLSILFQEELVRLSRGGLIGVARFSDVHATLMPVQKEVLERICGESFDNLLMAGSVISIALAYYEEHIRSIFQKSGGRIDVEKWNVYARAYESLNQELNLTAKKIAQELQGIPIPATFDKEENGMIRHVEDYFANAVSHRVIAELAGLGWRGKNGLLVNPTLSCAIRFASIIVPYEFEYRQPETLSCGECKACEDACSFIRNRNSLSDYREYCRRYINFLRREGVVNDICGKCIKSCYFNSIHAAQFQLEVREDYG